MPRRRVRIFPRQQHGLSVGEHLNAKTFFSSARYELSVLVLLSFVFFFLTGDENEMMGGEGSHTVRMHQFGFDMGKGNKESNARRKKTSNLGHEWIILLLVVVVVPRREERATRPHNQQRSERIEEDTEGPVHDSTTALRVVCDG